MQPAASSAGLALAPSQSRPIIRLSLSCHTVVAYHIMFQMFGYSVREVSKNSTPPLPSFPSFLGGGGSGPPGHNFLQKVLIFFLNFIFQGHFGTCRAENCTFRTYTMKYWAKQATFWHKQGGYYLCSVGSCGAILL